MYFLLFLFSLPSLGATQNGSTTSSTTASSTPSILVTTGRGQLLGRSLSTPVSSVYSFLVGSPCAASIAQGVPYAEPPVGARRWQAPELKTAWSGVYDARSFGAICPQLVAQSMITLTLSRRRWPTRATWRFRWRA